VTPCGICHGSRITQEIDSSMSILLARSFGLSESRRMSIAAFKNGASTMVRVPIKIAHHQDAAYSLAGGVRQTIGMGGVTLYERPDGFTCTHPDGIAHNCDYVEARNRLIPRAERNAHATLVGLPDPTGIQYSRVFMAEMVKLWGSK